MCHQYKTLGVAVKYSNTFSRHLDNKKKLDIGHGHFSSVITVGAASYSSFVCTVNQSGEVLHPAIGVWILEEHSAHILPTEVHLMRQLQHCFHSNVAATEASKLDVYTHKFF